MEILDKLGINGKIFLAQVVNFFLLMYILKRFLYQPLLDIIQKRESKIKEGLENASKAEKSLQEAESKALEKIKEATVEADKILEEARSEAKESREKTLAKAKEEITVFKDEARIHLEREKVKIMDEIRKESGELVVGLTEKLLGRKISDQDKSEWNKEVKEKLSKEA